MLVLCAIVVVAGLILDRAAQDPGDAAARTQDVSSTVLANARRRELPSSGRVTVRGGYLDGAFYLYDRSALVDYRQGRPWMDALQKAMRSGGRSGESDGVVAVTTCCGDGERVPLTVRRLPGPPRPATRGFDAAAEHDLDLPTGDLVYEENGGGGADFVLHVGPGEYRARISQRFGTGEPGDKLERYALDLWPRTLTGPSEVLRSAP